MLNASGRRVYRSIFACAISFLLGSFAVTHTESAAKPSPARTASSYDPGLSPEQNESNERKMATAREHEQRGERADDKEWTRAENELDKALTDLETSPSANTPLLGEPSYLDHGLIGYTIDENSRLRTVVLTREGKPEHVLAHRTMANLSPEALKLLVLEATDRTAEGLANAWWIVRNEKWLTADKGSVEWHVDPESRSVLVHLSPNISKTDEDALISAAPNYLTIERAEAEIEFLTDRHNDLPPQWGGAQLALHKNGSRHCTSGFTVKGKTTGTRYSMTAGHCVADAGGNGVSFWSGPYFVGSSASFSNFPTRDAVRLKNSNYSPLIWTDGSDVYNYRTVNGAANPVKDRKLCFSGRPRHSHSGRTIRQDERFGSYLPTR